VKILFKEQSFRITGACFEVYKEKGNGFLEAVYQECLARELEEQEIPYQEKPRLRLEYKGQALTQEYEPDFVCYSKIILEITAVKQLADKHRARVINFLMATGMQLGLLVNFGHCPKIEHEGFVSQRLSRVS